MWGNFHKYATSDNFVKEWRTTLASVSIEPSPILYQYITDTVFSHLIKENFPETIASESSGVKDIAVESILANDDVLFYWSTLSGNWEKEEADVLLRMIVEHWVTVRGFSFTSAFMEKFKQSNKKTIQKTKGLRKTVISDQDSDKEHDD